MAPLKVTIVGSGKWGSAIARIVGKTAAENPNDFDRTIRMWVFEKMVNDRKLSEIINTDHENVKYLPGTKLPDNVVAVPDLVDSCRDANVLIFVVPRESVASLCNQLKGNLGTNVQAISLIKGLSRQKPGVIDPIKLISEEIRELLGIECNVLMGANRAHDIANGNFCEATIGCPKKAEYGALLKKLFHTENFRITVVEDWCAVELCGALKNIVACAAGFADGLGHGDNTKAAVIRLGLREIELFASYYYKDDECKYETFFESCGVADLITSCYGGRNREVCEALVKTKTCLVEVEKVLLGGQSAQGPLTAKEVFLALEADDLVSEFPLFVVVHRICKGETAPEQLIDCLRKHPNASQKAK